MTGFREHCVDNQTEIAVQSLCFIMVLVGLFLAWTGMDDDPNITEGVMDRALFNLSTACLLVFLLLLNAGRSTPIFVPVLMALSYYWFAEGITAAESIRENESAYKDYDYVMSGYVISLSFSGVAVLFEGSLPSGRAMTPQDFLGAIAIVGGFAGLIAIWAYTPDDTTTFMSLPAGFTSQEFTKLSIRALMSMVMCFDSVLHFDPYINCVSVFMGTLTFCSMFYIGVGYDEETGDVKTTMIGCLVTALSLFFLTMFTMMTVALNISTPGSRKGFAQGKHNRASANLGGPKH